ncbi:MAG: hypothetical protein B6U86_05910 [Candidatus Altiarchaeales archaeon ex4484_43]|nr:MAG: hypothetical protein B6U86_05910 [Candidatus Altiarchaeales archaeon ex4484_43]
MCIMTYKKVVLPVKLERGLVKEMDELIKEHKFSSKAEIIRYGIRLVTLLERKKLVELNVVVKNLDIVSLDLDILERAFELQKQYGLGIFDSLHASACYLRDENREIISTDKALDEVDGINRIDLRDY